MKINEFIASIDRLSAINQINELKETLLFYLHRYRFDPFMLDKHTEQLNKLNELLKQLKEE